MRVSTSKLAMVILVIVLLAACKKGTDGAAGPAGPSGVEIYSITANPSVVRPGGNANLSVSAGDGVNSSLTYSWQADAGTLSSPASSSTVTWTAPTSVGSYMVSVEVTNAAGLKSRGYASILVSVSPSGPIITSVNPAEAKEGDQVRITGAGFGSTQGASSIAIGSMATITVISWSDSLITALVPTGATTGPVIVTAGGVASSPGTIVVLWTKENPENVAIVTAASDQLSPSSASDGAGGAIVTWADYRNGNYDIYAQRINSSGKTLWAANGIAVCTDAGEQGSAQIVSDGAGGAIITWADFRSGAGDIYTQRVNSSGQMLWTANGVVVSAAANIQREPQIASDDAGGAIITWTDLRGGSYYDLYAQRVSGSGAVQWTSDGVLISTGYSKWQPRIIPDGSGGAVIAWQDERSLAGFEVNAQRVNGNGQVQWKANGVVVSAASGNVQNPRLVSDGSGGAIITWYDFRSGSADIYAQRVDGSGQAMWTANGVPVAAVANDQLFPEIASDDSGGAIIAWRDGRTGSFDIYAQRVNNNGQYLWRKNGIPVCLSATAAETGGVISDGAGGAIITWGDFGTGNRDIFAQRMSDTGEAMWTANGVAVASADQDQQQSGIVPDGAGGAIVVWQDQRNGHSDIYAQGVSASGRQ